jgi:hypothetical protein
MRTRVEDALELNDVEVVGIGAYVGGATKILQF